MMVADGMMAVCGIDWRSMSVLLSFCCIFGQGEAATGRPVEFLACGSQMMAKTTKWLI